MPMALSNASGRNSQHQMSNGVTTANGDSKGNVTIFDSDMGNEKGKKKTASNIWILF